MLPGRIERPSTASEADTLSIELREPFDCAQGYFNTELFGEGEGAGEPASGFVQRGGSRLVQGKVLA